MTDARPYIERAAATHGISPDLVQALVLVESSGNTWAWNPEPHYRYLVYAHSGKPFRSLTAAERESEVPPPDFPCIAGDRDQEWWGQQASWGLMQVMGAVAREQGLRAPFLTVLCDPDVNLHYGCKHLAGLLLWAGGNVKQALAGYNGGRGGWTAKAPQAYAGKVLATLKAVHD